MGKPQPSDWLYYFIQGGLSISKSVIMVKYRNIVIQEQKLNYFMGSPNPNLSLTQYASQISLYHDRNRRKSIMLKIIKIWYFYTLLLDLPPEQSRLTQNILFSFCSLKTYYV